MRTLIMVLAGLLLWTACLGIAKFAGNREAVKMDPATHVFAALWLLVAAGNMWLGVAQAGYSVMEEAPIFVLIFTAPVAVALFVRWKFL